jgi:ABC-type lipopolysaccharide export system ATPase subunit
MVICAGPTGAGKTTTLYASLLEVNSAGTTIASRTLTGSVARVPRYRQVNGVWVGP